MLGYGCEARLLSSEQTVLSSVIEFVVADLIYLLAWIVKLCALGRFLDCAYWFVPLL